MTRHRLGDGATLVLRVDDGPWQRLMIDASSLQGATVTDAGEVETTAAALAAALDTRDGVTGGVVDDDRLVLVTDGTGETTLLEVDPVASTAAAAHVGEAAHSDPYRTGPARLVCTPTADVAVVENLTAAPVELQLPTGRILLPARGRLVVARGTTADGLLRRLVAHGDGPDIARRDLVAMALQVGVNVTEVDGRAAPVLPAAPTSVAAFVGRTRRGVPDRAVRLSSLDQFAARFDGHHPDGYVPAAVTGFFLNGGREAYVVRVTGAGSVAAADVVTRPGWFLRCATPPRSGRRRPRWWACGRGCGPG